jgi:NAD(P)-dependent dehydrogenase (short-subunit alcohol dehydrogenase family)
MKLEGKRVLITGGSSGIGFAIARALLAKGAGVAISGRRAAFVSAAVDELGKAGGSVTGIAADVGTVEGRALTLRQALDALGGRDVLVNNAGGARAGRIEATSQSEIEAIADMAAYPWIVPWKRQQQNPDDLVNLRRGFDSIAARAGTQRAYAKGEPFSAQHVVTEEGKKLLFGQTAASVARN